MKSWGDCLLPGGTATFLPSNSASRFEWCWCSVRWMCECCGALQWSGESIAFFSQAALGYLPAPSKQACAAVASPGQTKSMSAVQISIICRWPPWPAPLFYMIGPTSESGNRVCRKLFAIPNLLFCWARLYWVKTRFLYGFYFGVLICQQLINMVYLLKVW